MSTKVAFVQARPGMPEQGVLRGAGEWSAEARSRRSCPYLRQRSEQLKQNNSEQEDSEP